MLHRIVLAALIALCLAPRSAAADDTFFDSNGVKIRYVTAGDGEAVVLIHGWMGEASMWGRDSSGNAKLEPVPGFRVIALDCRGHGKSGKPHDPAKYGAEMAADVVRLLDHLKIKKAHLIGYSMGTFIAGKVAATHPERVLSVIYGGQAPLLTGEAGAREIDVFAKAVDEGKGLGAYLIEVTPPDGPKLTMEAANALAQIAYGGKDVKAWAVAGQSFRGLEVAAEDIAKCKAPALFIYGSKESNRLKERVSNLRKILGKCEVKVVDGGDHITTVAIPEFGKTIEAFLRSHHSKY
jgi:pimeloyl-ACP methyl ester carboxylesterase